MPAARLPIDERERLEVLKSCQILDTQSESSFDEVAALAARLSGCPVALITMVDATRLWVKASHGLPTRELPRDLAFCAHAILEPREALVVPDAVRDERFADNPLVTGAPNLRSYAGVPVVTSEGQPLGTLCVMDRRPREHEPSVIDALRGLARGVALNLELRRTLSTMRRMALTDALTGLPNRRAVFEALEARMAAGEKLAAVAIDLDRFKEANDAHGHAAGDSLLRVAAARLSASLRPGDVAGRLGGDEFVAILGGVTDEAAALAAAERLRERLNEPVPYEGKLLRLGATLGIAMGHVETPEALLRAANEAMSRAKRVRRGGVGRATAEDGVRLRREAAVLDALTAAVREEAPGLSAHLQPIVCAGSGEVRALEALARWEDPALGPVGPEEMFAIAARAGLEASASNLARRAALGIFSRLVRAGLPVGRLALNLSAAELMHEGVADLLEQQVSEAGLGLGSIGIEITEDALLDRVPQATLDRLAQLRAGGVRLGLDDFGTGSSGLAQLMRLPLDEIKLDRAFTRRLGLDGRAERIVEGAIRLAESMRLSVVAEGVETQAQAQVLRAMGCDMLQGWLIAPALSEAALREWLPRQRPKRSSTVVPLQPVGLRQVWGGRA